MAKLEENFVKINKSDNEFSLRIIHYFSMCDGKDKAFEEFNDIWNVCHNVVKSEIRLYDCCGALLQIESLSGTKMSLSADSVFYGNYIKANWDIFYNDLIMREVFYGNCENFHKFRW